MNMNLYNNNLPFMTGPGTFGRCRHGNTLAMPCFRCGLFHPLKFFKHWWSNYA